MSLRLAYASGVVSIVLSALTLYNITPKQGQAWSVTIVDDIVIGFHLSNNSLHYHNFKDLSMVLSCNNPSEIAGACPTTRTKS